MEITTEELRKRLRLRFCTPQWILCEEFETPIPHREFDGKFSRRIDAMAHALNPNKPYLFGFEIKVSRGDWLTELKDPSKAEIFKRCCNAWYLVSPLKGVIKSKNELPEGWGWIATHGKGLAIKKKSAWVDNPEYCAAIIAGFLRRSYLGRIDEQQRQWSEAYSKGYDAGEWEIKHLRNRIEKLKQELTPDPKTGRNMIKNDSS